MRRIIIIIMLGQKKIKIFQNIIQKVGTSARYFIFCYHIHFLTRKLSGSRKETEVGSQDSVGDKFKDY